MPRNILVVGKGRPFHTTEKQAELWIQNGNAAWIGKGKRRVKYVNGKNSAPKLRGLSCLVGNLALDLRRRDTRDYAETFLRSQLGQRERGSIERLNTELVLLSRDVDRVESERVTAQAMLKEDSMKTVVEIERELRSLRRRIKLLENGDESCDESDSKRTVREESEQFSESASA